MIVLAQSSLSLSLSLPCVFTPHHFISLSHTYKALREYHALFNSTFHILTLNNPVGYYHCPYFTDEKTETHKGQIMYFGSILELVLLTFASYCG